MSLCRRANSRRSPTTSRSSLWYGLAFDLAVVGFLGLTAQWWLRPSSKNAKPLPPVRTPRWFWPLVIIAMVANAWLCFPRLFHSFWHDENYLVRNAILGHYVPKPDGSLKLKETKWSDTLFFYRKPNHTFYSGVVRAINDTWRKVAKPKGLQFNRAAHAPARLHRGHRQHSHHRSAVKGDGARLGGGRGGIPVCHSPVAHLGMPARPGLTVSCSACSRW